MEIIEGLNIAFKSNGVNGNENLDGCQWQITIKKEKMMKEKDDNKEDENKV